MPLPNDLRTLAIDLSALAAQAGRLILDVARTELTIAEKGDFSPVTNADIRAEAHLLEGLARLLPGIPVLAEESASRAEIPDIGDTFLVVDPLDGTREFLAGRPEYTVNIGLVSGGRPVLGVLHAPALARIYWGAEGTGAARADDVPMDVPIHAPVVCRYVPIRTRTADDAPVALTSRGHNDATTEAFLDRLGIAERVRIGSAIKFAMLAEGAADIYPRFGPTMEWDLAAGHALIAAAGGAVLTPEGDAIRYGKVETGFRNGPFVAWGYPPR
ncbi:3'(2'),5'-bisphosphate nucleotidase CysQ [Terrihabitans sp. B22-R8]|uniref:3'(2'),5'-bisphosphate nucleotidase CysQ n=1 Tax=Terrihabitans sp. B22-R8 TaxID=3425128 RepID=UPI00403D19DF